MRRAYWPRAPKSAPQRENTMPSRLAANIGLSLQITEKSFVSFKTFFVNYNRVSPPYRANRSISFARFARNQESLARSKITLLPKRPQFVANLRLAEGVNAANYLTESRNKFAAEGKSVRVSPPYRANRSISFARFARITCFARNRRFCRACADNAYPS